MRFCCPQAHLGDLGLCVFPDPSGAAPNPPWFNLGPLTNAPGLPVAALGPLSVDFGSILVLGLLLVRNICQALFEEARSVELDSVTHFEGVLSLHPSTTLLGRTF